ncbi:hypothetical protein RQP46_004239 [Phenoliferia psychrophenolica]
MDTQALEYGTCTAFLELGTTGGIEEHLVPTNSLASDEAEREAVLEQSDDHALVSSTFFPPEDKGGFVLSRVVEDGYALELRWMSRSTGPGEHDERTFPPARFAFPARVVSSPAFAMVDGALQVIVLSEHGYLYALIFTIPTLFNETNLEEGEWSHEFKVLALEGRVPVLLHQVDHRRVIIATEDGFTVAVNIVFEEGGIDETVLKSSKSFFSRGLIPSFSTRNLAGDGSASSPSQLVALASSPRRSFAFGVTRDRRLKSWKLGSGEVFKDDALPNSDSTASSSPSSNKLAHLLPPTPQPFLKIIHGDDDRFFLVLYSSGVFYLYRVNTFDNGDLCEYHLVHQKSCPATPGTLVDFDVVKYGIKGPEDTWTLWTLWEEGGAGEVRFVALPPLDEMLADDDEDEDEDEREWTAVTPGSTGQEWTAAYFDELLDDEDEGGVHVFLEHLLYPGRYPPATLLFAINTYTSLLISETDPHTRPEVLDPLYEFATIEHRIAAVVASCVSLEHSPQTGAPLYELHNKHVRAEWLRFVAITNESRQSALFPLALGVDAQRKLALVLHRDALSAPMVSDTVHVLQRLSHDPSARSELLALPESALESSYEHLAPRGVRHDLFHILAAISTLESALPPFALRKLETELVKTVRTPLNRHISDIAVALYEDSLEPFVGATTNEALLDTLRVLVTPEASFQVLWTLLTTSEVVRPVPEGRGTPSDLTVVLLADAITSSVEARYDLVKGLATLLLFLNGDEACADVVPELDSLTSATLATLHTLASLRWVVRQASPPRPSPPSDELNLAERLGSLHVNHSATSDLPPEAQVASFSLLSGLLRLPQYSPPIPTSTTPLAYALATALSTFIAHTRLITQKRQVIDAAADVDFASTLQRVGLPQQALEFVEMYPTGAGMLFVKGLAYLDTGRGDDAVVAFKKAAPALLTRLDEASGISLVLPVDIAGSLARYYRHVVDLFLQHDLDEAVAIFAALALDACAEEGDDDVDELWATLFTAQCDLTLYEDAYVTLASIPDPKTKSDCLAHLVEAVCEDGATALLTTWAFVGLQAELERLLSHRANAADPLATPNYHRILYAYYVSKGDYRSAGATMFQQARRIGKLQARDLDGQHEIATLQCQSYLAAANALSLVDKKHAWVTVAADDSAAGEPTSKRRKITYCIPDKVVKTAMGGSALSRPAEIVELADIRREYKVALSRLELSEGDEYGELGRTIITVDPSATVKAYSLRGAYESALATAHALDVDMSDLFEKLTESCVALSRTTTGLPSSVTDWVALNDDSASWEGSLASKAWRLLECYLERYDDPTTLQYRLVVLEHSLAVNANGQVPSWLVDAFLERDGQLLVRTMLKFDRLEDAFAYSLVAIAAAPPPTSPAATTLPYSLFDQLLALTPESTSALSPDALKTRQRDLKAAIATRLAEVERADRSLAKSNGV